MEILLAVLFFSCAGILETVYLIKKRIAAEKPFCPMGGCERVLTSKYSKTFFIHNDILGLIFYSLVAFVSVLLSAGTGPVNLWGWTLIVLAAAGALMSAAFTYIQWRVIKAWCLWCLASAFTSWIIALIVLINFLKYAY